MEHNDQDETSSDNNGSAKPKPQPKNKKPRDAGFGHDTYPGGKKQGKGPTMARMKTTGRGKGR